MPIDPISADPHSLGAEFSELGGQVTEMTAFLRSTRRHRLRIEEQHDRPRLDQVGKRDRSPVLVQQLKFVDEIAFFQHNLHDFWLDATLPRRSRALKVSHGRDKLVGLVFGFVGVHGRSHNLLDPTLKEGQTSRQFPALVAQGDRRQLRKVLTHPARSGGLNRVA